MVSNIILKNINLLFSYYILCDNDFFKYLRDIKIEMGDNISEGPCFWFVTFLYVLVKLDLEFFYLGNYMVEFAFGGSVVNAGDRVRQRPKIWGLSLLFLDFYFHKFLQLLPACFALLDLHSQP